MTKRYDNLGLKFLYPETWNVTEEIGSTWPRSVTIQTPEGGFWMAQIHNDADPHRLTLQVLKAMREEYKDVEADSVLEQKAFGFELVGFDLQFYCLDLLIGAAIRGTLLGPNRKLTLIVMFQAEDREFERLQVVSDAMLTNLLQTFDDSEE